MACIFLFASALGCRPAQFKQKGNRSLSSAKTSAEVLSVTSSKANGAYASGASIAIEVVFSEAVTVSGGVPSLTLETGSADRVAVYASGSGTASLSFTYEVQSGDASSDLDYVSEDALELNGATIKSSAGVDAELKLPEPGNSNSLAGQKTLVIDTFAPTIAAVSSDKVDGSYKAGDTIDVKVTFSESVTVTGVPTLTLETGTTDQTISYASGSGTAVLTFAYTVQAGDSSGDLDYISTAALDLNSGTIRDAAGNNATSTLPTVGGSASLGGQKALVIDTTAPSVSDVTSSKANGTYVAGNAIDVTVTFSEAVVVTGTPTLTLETGATDRAVNYFSGSGSNALTFRYTIQAGDTSGDLDYVSTSALDLNSGTIKDAAGNSAALVLPTVGGANSIAGQKALVIDATVPTITDVTSSTGNGTKKLGDTVTITVTFSESVTVDTSGGTPSLTLETGSTDRAVNYASGSPGTTLTFNYTVQAGDISGDLDYASTSALSLNSGTIRDSVGNDADLTLPALGGAHSIAGQKALVVDGAVPTVTSVSSTKADGSYKAGTAINVTVTFSENVTVDTSGGTPSLVLETGGTDQTINYVSGSGGTTLTFTYTVQAGDTSSDLDYVATNSLVLNGATIKDSADNDATLTLPAVGGANSIAGQKAIAIDTADPTVTSVSSTKANGSYKAGDTIDITVTFSEAVTVVTTGGTPTITLETGGTDQAVNYSSGSTTTTLTFTYTVQSGDTASDLDYVATNSLALNSGTIKDAAGNDAVITLPAVGGANSIGGQKALVIDTSVPTVTNVSSTKANGSYKAGDTIDITVTFSEAVTVVTTGGTPTITLETGGTDQAVNYSSGSTTTTLTFTYTVQAGDTSSDLDYVATNSLALNSGTIKDASGNDATLTLPATGGGSSIAGQKALVIDTTVPTVTSVSSSSANTTYRAGDTVDVTVTFSETVTVVTTGGTPSITLETGTTDRAVSYSSGSPGTTLTFTYTVQSGDTASDLDYVATSSLALNSGTIKDAAGNDATLTLPAVGGANSIAGQKAIAIDTTAPTVTSVSSTKANGSYTAAETLDVTVTFSEAVTVVTTGGTPAITLETGATDRAVDYASGSTGTTLTFTYTVQAGDTSGDLDYAATNALALNSGTIKDGAGNDATLTLPALGGASSIAGQKALIIDTTAPTWSNTLSNSAENASLSAIPDVSFTANASDTAAGSGIQKYQYSIGTTSGGTQTVNWADLSGGASPTSPLQVASLTLTAGTVYYVNMRVMDNVGLTSTVYTTSFTPVTTPTISYAASTGTTGTVSSAMSVTPSTLTAGGGSITNCTSSPALPAWASLNTSTCVISGTPNAVLSSTAYTITVTNSVGLTANANVTLEVSATYVGDFVDDGNTASGFGGATHVGTAWSTNKVVLASAGSCDATATNCAELNASWTPQWNSLVAYWKMNESAWNGTASEVVDSVGTHHGQRAGDATTSSSSKLGSKAGTFDGTGDYFYVPDSADFDFGTGDFTVAGWIYPTTTGNYFGLVSSQGNSAADFIVQDHTGKLRVSSYTAEIAISGRSFVSNAWNHFAVTRVGTSLKLYIAGQLDTTVTDSTAWVSTSAVDIGRAFADNYYFPGRMDDFAIWKGAGLSAAEIQTIYSRQSAKYAGYFTSRTMDYGSAHAWDGLKWIAALPFAKELPDGGSSESSSVYSALVGSTGSTGDDDLMSNVAGIWHLNESALNSGPSGSDFEDKSGNGNNGTESGGVTPGYAGVFGNAAYFDGNDTITLPLVSNATSNVSISVWVNYFSSSSYTVAFSNGSNDGYGIGIGWSNCNTANNLQVLKGGVSCGSIADGTTLPTHQWAHLALVSNGTGWTLYKNGVSVGGATFTPNTPTTQAQIGGSGFKGLIDEVAFWTRTLHADEVKQLYQRGASRIKLQTRVCTSADCSDRSSSGDWLGPDGTNGSYFSWLHNNSSYTASGGPDGDVLTYIKSLFFGDFTALTWPSRQYFQYRAILEADDTDTTLAPSLTRVEVNAPTLNYAAGSYTAYTGSALTITPTLTVHGTSITNCTVSPALPAWATLNTSTCAITGTPDATLSSTTYTVTVTNSGGATTTTTVTISAVPGFIDSGNDATLGFGAGTKVGVSWNTDTVNKLILGPDTDCDGNMSEGETVYTNCAELDSSWTPQWSSLVSYWKMNEASWNGTASEVVDSKGSNHGVRSGNATTTSSSKLGPYAGTFDGTGDYFSTGSSATLSSSSVTFSAWIKTSSTAQQYVAENGIYYLAVNMYGGNMLCLYSPNWDCATVTLTDGNWHHIAFMYDGSTKKIYIDGAQFLSASAAGGVGGGAVTLNIASRPGSGGDFNGAIDDVAIWSTALTAAELQTVHSRQSAKYSGQISSRVMDYGSSISWDGLKWLTTLPFGKALTGDANNSGTITSADSETSTTYSALVGSTGSTGDNNLMSNILGLWHFDGTAGTIADNAVVSDSSGNGRDGAAKDGDGTNTIAYEYGKLSTGIRFDGTNDYVEVGNLDGGGSAITFSVWLKKGRISGGSDDRIIASSNNNGWGVGFNANGTIWLSKIGVSNTASTAAINDTETWHHVVVTHDSSTACFYVDGVQSNCSAYSATYNSSGGNYTIASVAGAQNFRGVLDEVAVWDRVLHADEVKQLFRRGANRIKFQVRSCNDNACSGEDWVGPDNTNGTYFSELHNYAPYNYDTNNCSATNLILTGSPSLLFSCFTSALSNLTSQRYFQYRAILESDDASTNCNYGSGATWCSPELKSVEIKP